MTLEIAVRRIRVRLLALDGTRREAVLFLRRVGTLSTHWQSLGELLNDADVSYLPCEVSDATELWNLESIVQVELVEDDRDSERIKGVGSFRRAAGVHLITGEVLNGYLIYEAEEQNARISDFMNAHAPRFILLESDERTIYVRAGAIARIQIHS